MIPQQKPPRPVAAFVFPSTRGGALFTKPGKLSPGRTGPPCAQSGANMDARRARLILNALPNIGPVTVRRLLDDLGPDPAALLRAPRDRLLAVKGVGPAIADSIRSHAALFDAETEARKLMAHGVRFLIPDDPEYPASLKELYDPPIGLYSRGEYSPGRRCVAVVGTRAPSPYGKKLARDTAAALATAGWCVVSGLARGIDTEAHTAVLASGGRTVAVLGNGIDLVYPPENAALSRDIARHGLLLSEFPLGRPADKRTFPMRNRLVAGLCRAVVVIESDTDGGSMITARFAAELGRTVCAFPGRVDHPGARGCHALIRDGATLVTGPEEILEELGDAPRQTELPLDSADTATRDGDAAGHSMLRHFAAGARHTADSLTELTGLPVPRIAADLLLLELAGKIIRNRDGRYESAG